MALTRRDFESVATSLGLQWRFGRGDGDPVVEGTRNAVMFAAAAAVADGLKESNPRFDFDRFMAWVIEVSEGRRGADGKLRAA